MARPSAGAAPAGNGSSTSSRMRPTECRVRDFSSFEFLLALSSTRSSDSNCARTGASAAARRSLEDRREGVANLELAHHVVLRRLHRHLGQHRRRSRPRRIAPHAGRDGIAAAMVAPCWAIELVDQSGSIDFGLPTCERRSSIVSQIRRISMCASSSARRMSASGISSAPASTIVSASRVPTTIRSSVESAWCCRGGRRTSSPSIRPTRMRRPGSEERQRGDRERGRWRR